MVKSLAHVGWLVVWLAVRFVDTGFQVRVDVETYRFLVGAYSYFKTFFLEDVAYTLFLMFSVFLAVPRTIP